MFKQLLTAAVFAGAVAVPTTSVSADPPFEQVFSDFFLGIRDDDIGKGVFVNIEVRDLCDWAGSGFQGPAPVKDDVVARGVVTGKGAVVGKIDADLYIEIWDYDEDADLSTPCTALADELANGDAPLAIGATRFSGITNDAFESGTRSVTVGERLSATLTGQDGTEYRYRYSFRTNDRCAVGDLGVPSCRVENSSLRTR